MKTLESQDTFANKKVSKINKGLALEQSTLASVVTDHYGVTNSAKKKTNINFPTRNQMRTIEDGKNRKKLPNFDLIDSKSGDD